MEHRTTAVKFTMESADLFAISQNWANEFHFSLYEKSGNRAIYSKRIRLMKAWLSVESNSENARVEAWLSGPGVGPDFVGNAWRGWKIALPHGPGFGPQFIYRKQFDTLLSSLQSKTQNAIGGKDPEASSSQPILDKSTLAKGITILSMMTFLVGATSLFAAMSLLLKSAFPSLMNEMLTSGICSVIIGGLLLASSRALTKGKIAAIWFYGGSILMDGIYNIIAGRPVNYLFISFGLLFIWQILKFRNEWNLS